MKATIKLIGKVENKIKAIKGVRFITGLGLKEAKELIEQTMEAGTSKIDVLPNSAAPRKHEAIALLKEGGFSYFEQAPSRDKILIEVKKLIKMSVENDQNDIATELLQLRERLF